MYKRQAHGDHFTAGLDLAEVGPAVAAGKTLAPDDMANAVDPLDLFGRRRTKPVVCAVQGICFTIGIELLLACDLAIAAEGTRFAQMEVRRGIMPFGGATLRFPAAARWPCPATGASGCSRACASSCLLYTSPSPRD